tara:strand:- start:75 stop:1076 length:1002 start_codon:yes stop_codon:yes gene_type:complete
MTRINRLNEYGGYLPIETFFSNENVHFFSSADKSVAKLNCGRSCFYVAARSAKIKKVYVPYFTCIDTSQPFKDLGIQVSPYKLDKNLMPQNLKLADGEFLLWTNYYGNASDDMISFVENEYGGQLIVDNCHAFFCRPLKDAFNCYTARKFIGVSDGAYLVSNFETKLNTDGLKQDKTYPYMQHLFKQNEEGTNEGYELSLENEKRLEKNYGLMSKTTENILKLVDYQSIKLKREKNFLTLHSCLSDFNEFPVNERIGTQMHYPFKCKDRLLKDKLLKERVYSPTLWRHVVDQVGEESTEAEYALETTLLPVDQRYSKFDMKFLGDLVKKLAKI